MSGWMVAGIIIVVLGYIVSNLMMLKYTAKMKMNLPPELRKQIDQKTKSDDAEHK